MKTKIIGAAVAAALLGLSGVAFGQGAAGGGSAGGTAASGQDTPREASRANSGPGSAAGTPGVVTSGSATTTAPATSMASRCDTLTGAEKTRCMRDERPSSGSSVNPGVPVTQKPAESGVGAIDKTHPGQEPVAPNQANPRDAGTSSAGAGGAGGPGGK